MIWSAELTSWASPALVVTVSVRLRYPWADACRQPQPKNAADKSAKDKNNVVRAIGMSFLYLTIGTSDVGSTRMMCP